MNFENKANDENNSPDLIALYNKKATILYVSNVFEDFFGYKFQELVGFSLASFLDPSNYENIKDFLVSANANDIYTIKNKQNRYLSVRVEYKKIQTISDDNIIEKIIIIKFDLTGKNIQLEQQQYYLSTLLNIQHELLDFQEKDKVYSKIVRFLGKCLDVSRVYIFENYFNNLEQISTQKRAEFIASDFALNTDSYQIKKFIHEKYLPRWQKILEKGEIISGLIDDFPESESIFWASQNILSILIIPIFIKKEFYGFIGLDHCHKKNIWHKLEIDLLSTVATAICLALERKRTEQALTKSEEKYNKMFDNISMGIFQISINGQFIKVNSRLAKIYGYDSPEDLLENMKNVENQLYVNPEARKDLIQSLNNYDLVLEFETQVYRKDGSIIWISENIKNIYNELGELLYYEGTVEDITARRVAEEQLLYGALHDGLTGLPNRLFFINRLKIVIESASNDPNYNYAILFLDLDSFKVVNDSLGHLVGDELLKQVAQKLKECLSKKDTIARFGGDEFAILVENISSIKEALKITKNIYKKLQQPFLLDNYEIFISASIGITSSGIKYQKPEEILRDADVAMYQAKSIDKGNYAIFNPKIQQKLLKRLQLESYLRRAIEFNELQLYYQPIICLNTGNLLGFEALVRWQHPIQGFVSPIEFIPIAEETGLIKSIGWWVFCKACLQSRQWQESFPHAQNLLININVSAYQLQEIDLGERIDTFLKTNNVTANNIKLEITETCFLKSLAAHIELIQKIQKLGIGLCIDDFGTGYSSLDRLHKFPVDTLKIDRSFVKSLRNKGGDTIILTIITLAQTLGMNIVAEGIETEEQLQKLIELGCKKGQGYLFSRPIDAEAATQLIANNSSLI